MLFAFSIENAGILVRLPFIVTQNRRAKACLMKSFERHMVPRSCAVMSSAEVTLERLLLLVGHFLE